MTRMAARRARSSERLNAMLSIINAHVVHLTMDVVATEPSIVGGSGDGSLELLRRCCPGTA
jgi:hypothetical protein